MSGPAQDQLRGTSPFVSTGGGQFGLPSTPCVPVGHDQFLGLVPSAETGGGQSGLPTTPWPRVVHDQFFGIVPSASLGGGQSGLPSIPCVPVGLVRPGPAGGSVMLTPP
ncbi:MAG: hypothetical protein L6R19_18565 [Alphaproteobacteria bacterium]|nr:hypothetical protein [Alphaproteobacteria bacterium]